MSDTPKVDKALEELTTCHSDYPSGAIIEFMRSLERENRELELKVHNERIWIGRAPEQEYHWTMK